MKRVIIVHGFNSTPSMHWFPWLKRELEALGHTVIVPAMPHPLRPQRQEWQQTLATAVGTVDEKTLFVTHSLGTLAVLQYLESLPEDTRCVGLVAVAPLVREHYEPLIGNFFEELVGFGTLRARIKHMTVLADPHDPIAPFDDAEYLVTTMHCNLESWAHRGHFDERIDGVKEAPEIFNAVSDIIHTSNFKNS